VQLAKGRTVEQKQQFVEAITKESVKTLYVKEEWITVILDEYDKENCALSGKLHSIKFGKKGTK